MKMTTPLMKDLHQDHLNLVTLIDVARRVLHEIATDDDPDYELLEDTMRYLTTYCDAQHHPNEDVVFQVLEQRAPDAAAEIQRIEGEHGRLGTQGRQFLGKLQALSEDAILPRQELVDEGTRYFEALHAHMSAEETSLFPLADRMLTDADWHAVRERILVAIDPLFGPSINEDFRRLWERIEAHRSTAQGG